jgi:hypothetical protein
MWARLKSQGDLRNIPQGLNSLRKREAWGEEVRKNIPQGLKPIHFVGVIGTTEVVPFQSPYSTEFSATCKARADFAQFAARLKSCPFKASASGSARQAVNSCPDTTHAIAKFR